MKLRYVTLLLAALACICPAGCGKNNETTDADPSVIVQPEQGNARPTVIVIDPKTAPTMTQKTPTPLPTDIPTPTKAKETPTPTPTPFVDTEAPVINGATDITVVIGGTVAYTKNVTAEDNSGEVFSFRGDNPNMFVDVSSVNTKKAGDYPVTYRAVDAAGNETIVSVTLYVTDADAGRVFELADGILSKIVTDEMTVYEKAHAVWDWMWENMIYSSGNSDGDYIKAAYKGLTAHEGACYVFAGTAKVLLTRAGVPNMIVEKYPSENDPHFWNIINTGEGWYHFDATKWHVDTADREAVTKGIFYWTDERIASSGSNSIRNQHKYDKSLYPDIE